MKRLLVNKIMQFCMLRLIFKQLKIFNSIIILDTINVMNGFFGKKKSSKMLFHYKGMFSYIARRICFWMKRTSNINIFSYTFSPSPSRTFFSSLSISDSFTMFRCKFFTFSCFAQIISPFFRKWRSLFSFMSKTDFSFMFFRFWSILRKIAFPNIRTFTRTTLSPLEVVFRNIKFYFTNSAKFNHLYFSLFLLIIAQLIIPSKSFSTQWRSGDSTQTIPGSTAVSDIDTVSYENIVSPLDRLLSKYKRAADLEYNSASSIDITAGEISCQNTAGTVTLMSQNTSTTTLTWSDLDTGAEASNTTYYVYGKCTTSTDTFTGVISVNSSTPDSGAATYYKLLGSFLNDASGDITVGDISAPAEEQDIAIETVYDYGTSTSSFTARTTGVLVAHGIATMSSGTATITNLPFSATPSCVVTRLRATDVSQAVQLSAAAATTITIRDSQSANDAVHWVCIGE